MAHGCTYCTDDFHCEKFTSEKCVSWCYGKDYPCKDRRISNADRIRSMTDEEMANWYFSEFFPNAPYCNKLECYRDSPCEQCLLDWLRTEVTE